jgi:hypothetical protein
MNRAPTLFQMVGRGAIYSFQMLGRGAIYRALLAAAWLLRRCRGAAPRAIEIARYSKRPWRDEEGGGGEV